MAKFPVAVITDEFTQDFERMCQTAVEIGVPALEVRTVWDQNIVDLSDEKVKEIKALADRYGRSIIGVASPVFKCVHPAGGPIDQRFHQDAFKAAHTFEDQPKVLRRAVEVANMLEAPIVRVFSFWRTVEPLALRDPIIESLQQAVEIAAPHGVTIGLENEHACNLSTAKEVRPVLDAVPHPKLGLVWDPANSSVSGFQGYPDDYREAPADRIVHVHAKDGFFEDGMEWCVIGEGSVGWAGQLTALVEDGYEGMVSVETHWGGPGGNKFQGSVLCAKALQELIAAA
ncbi:MAG: TIM barrel protein [Acidobacteria bacterium]|nr:TIM barrel protein [Acidobacteriota bacterium]